MASRFEKVDTNTRQSRRYNTVGRRLTVCSIPRSDNTNPVAHFLPSVNDLIEHALRDVDDSDMVGMTIQNQVNQNDKSIQISFRRKDQLSAGVIWSGFQKVSQSNSRFNALDTLVVTVHTVRTPVGFGKIVLKSRGRSLSVLAHLKRSTVEVKEEENCLAHALVIAIAKVENDPDYKAYRQGRKICHVIQTILETTGIDLSNGAGIPELIRFQEHFREYKIVDYHGLSCKDIMFEEQVDSTKILNILYDDVERHYRVIAKLTPATARKYVCKGSNKACKSDLTHACDQTCCDCMACPPCAFSGVRIPCCECNRHFRIRTCYDKHKQRTMNKTSVCERKRCCATCGRVVTRRNHECNKRFCDNSNQNKEIVHLCYMRPLKDALPPASDKVLYVFSDFETTQNTEDTDEAKLNLLNIVCVQQFCSRCEEVEDGDCVRSGKRKHSFWQVPVGNLISYLTGPLPWAKKIVAIAHNAKAFDLHFIPNRAILLKWKA